MKKQISLFLVIAVLFTIFPFAITVNAYSDYDTDTVKIGYITYQKMRREKTVNGKIINYYNYIAVKVDEKDENGNPITEMNFKDYIDGIPVVSLSFRNDEYDLYEEGIGIVRRDYSSVTKINIPNTVESIRYYSFKGCKKIKSLKIPESVKRIEFSAFRGMENLESITLPSKITVIPEFAFYGDKNLKKVVFKGKITKISTCAFEGCEKLNIKIPKTVKIIAGNSFQDCKSMKSVTVPKTVKRLHSGVFINSGLVKASIQKNIDIISTSIFYNCANLKQVTFRGTTIPLDTFKNCKKLKKIIITNTKNAPRIHTTAFNKTSPGIKFYVKNKKIAKQLNQRLKKTKAKKFKIYAAKKRIY